MSSISRFNREISLTQDQRPDVRRIINHAVNATHACPILANGYCRTCPAYIAFRNNIYVIVNQQTIAFNYEAEYLLATTMARRMLLNHNHVSRIGIPPPQRTRISDIRPPVESTHICPTCTRQHLDQHTCPTCTEPHLRDHTCPVAPADPVVPDVPDNTTEEERNTNGPNIDAAIWTELQSALRATAHAPAGTPLYRLHVAITSARTTPRDVINSLRLNTVTTTNTVYVPVPCTLDHNPPAVPCTLEHLPSADPNLPAVPRGVLMDPTVPQTMINIFSHLLTHPRPLTTHYGNAITRDFVDNLIHALTHRTPNDHWLNDSPEQASSNFARALRWSALMHRSEDLLTLPHTEPCLYHPCAISYFHQYAIDHNIPHGHFVHLEDFIRSFVSQYIDHVRTHAYAPQFVTEVTAPMPILGRYANIADISRPYDGPYGHNSMVPSQHQHTITLPRARYDFEEQDVPETNQGMILRLRN